MRYVIFDAQTREIRSAVTGPEPSDPGPRLEVGDVGEIEFEGALKNYVFVSDEPQPPGTRPLRGRVQRKPKQEWDLEAEEREHIQRRNLMRFHQLDIAEVRKVEVHLMVPSRFSFLEGSEYTYDLRFEDLPLEVRLVRQNPVPLNAQLEFGGYTISFHKTLVRFDLSGHEDFILKALESRLGGKGFDEVGRRLFASRVLRNECLQLALRLTNHLIECYRVTYDDPAERPIGPVDVLAGAIVIELKDGVRQAQHSGISLASDIKGRKWFARRIREEDNQEKALLREGSFRHLLQQPHVPFAAAAVSELRKAHLYGQYRECVVWAGTIIANVIEDILLARLPKTSPEYKRLRTNSAEVRGATKRGAYFKKATGRTLGEWLEDYEKRSMFWRGLAKNVESILNERNLMLHRKKGIGPREAQLSFETCMNFLFALQYGIPFNPEDVGYEL